MSRDRAVQGAVEAWYSREVGPLPTAATKQAGRFGAGPWAPGSAVAAERVRLGIWERFERALRSGTIRLVEHQPTFVTLTEVPALQVVESTRDAQATYFEATVVDEVGEPLAGLDMVLTCEGRSYELTTNGAGLVRQDGVTASRRETKTQEARIYRRVVPAHAWARSRRRCRTQDAPRARRDSGELSQMASRQIRRSQPSC